VIIYRNFLYITLFLPLLLSCNNDSGKNSGDVSSVDNLNKESALRIIQSNSDFKEDGRIYRKGEVKVKNTNVDENVKCMKYSIQEGAFEGNYNVKNAPNYSLSKILSVDGSLTEKSKKYIYDTRQKRIHGGDVTFSRVLSCTYDISGITGILQEGKTARVELNLSRSPTPFLYCQHGGCEERTREGVVRLKKYNSGWRVEDKYMK